MFNKDFNILATGVVLAIRCVAFQLSQSHQGEGLTNQIIAHLINVQMVGTTAIYFFILNVNRQNFSMNVVPTFLAKRFLQVISNKIMMMW